MTFAALLNKPKEEFGYFLEMPRAMRVLLLTNMIYAFALPVIDIFVGAYIMRSSNDPKIVAIYQLTVYTGIPITFLLNGFLLRYIKIANLYSFGMLLSGISMMLMMSMQSLSITGVGVAGILMGCSFGFFWANRDLLTLNNTHDLTRNYYYGIETFFYTITYIVVPLAVGWFLSQSEMHGWFSGNISTAYQLVMVAVFLLTVLSSLVIHKEKFTNPIQKEFLFLKFHSLWRKMLVLAGLKGMVQGYLVTAPAILIMRLVGNEGSVGLVQGVSGIVTAIILYFLGRTTKPADRIYIFGAGIFVFLIGTVANGLLFSAIGVMVFVLCKVLFTPLHDIAYFPTQMRVIDIVSKIEKRNEFAYIFNHEFGLYIGRFFGLGLFIYLDSYVSEMFALKYALIIIAFIQILSIPMARHIIRECDQLSKPS
ncbi:MAG: MFS transporter [Bacteroidetes bacterium]|nr:MFS transporter [Bacteroidota bacterium]